jgi:hypothetical protein
MVRNRPAAHESQAANDRLDAAERALEWGAAMLKARKVVRHRSRLRRIRRTEGSGEKEPGSRNRDQELLFERLRASAAKVAGSWDCTIEGSGDNMVVLVSEPASDHVVWTHLGSPAGIEGAFEEWLNRRASSRTRD